MDTSSSPGVFEDHVCRICKKTFRHKKSGIKHERLVHKILITKTGTFRCLYTDCDCTYETLDELNNHVAEIHPLPKAPAKYCEKCNKTFSKGNLNKHLRDIHNIETRTGTMLCPQDGCEFTCPTLASIRNHLAEKHQATNVIERTNMAFLSEKDFLAWKYEEERRTSSLFVSLGGLRAIAKTVAKRKIYYCNRSGKYEPLGSDTKRLKFQGSCKTGKCCPAVLETAWYPDGSIQLTYWSGHFGHTNEAAHVRLTYVERAEIAEKLAQGVSFDTILDEVRSSATGPLKRIHLLSRRDLRNIQNSFNKRLKKDHENDPAGVALWVDGFEKFKDESPVLLYKSQGVRGDCNDALLEDDFILVLMTQAQSETLKTLGGDKICIDRYYGTNENDLHLTTVLVIDVLGAGFPVAFCVSNKINAIHMEQFFAAIKEKVGRLNTSVFMSDDSSTYYDAWEVVMGESGKHLLCPWHVSENWRQQIQEKVIGGIGIEGQVYRKLMSLMKTKDQESFKSLLPATLDYLSSDKRTMAFGIYFQETYASRAEIWAYCFRAQVGIKSNKQLDATHRQLKNIFSEGQKEKQMGKFLTALLKLSRGQTFERMIQLCKDSSTKTVQEINQQHQKSLDIDSADVQPFEEGWKVTSQTNSSFAFKVSRVEEKCPTNCKLTCEDCRVCVHMYTCTCSSAGVHSTVCKHVHAVIQKYGQPDRPDDSEMDVAITSIHEEIMPEYSGMDIAIASIGLLPVYVTEDAITLNHCLDNRPEDSEMDNGEIASINEELITLNHCPLDIRKKTKKTNMKQSVKRRLKTNMKQSVKRRLKSCLGLVQNGNLNDSKLLQLDVLLKNWQDEQQNI